MDSVAPVASPASPWRSRLAMGLLAVMALAVGSHVGRWGMAFAGGSDEAGYVHNATLLLEGRLTEATRPIPGVPPGTLRPQAYETLGRVVSPDGQTLRPYYPFGYPVIIALFDLLDGPFGHGVWLTLVSTVMAVPFLVYFLGREFGLDRDWAVVAAAGLTFSPMTIFMAVRPMSDLFTMVLASAAMLAGLRAHRSPGWAVALGLLFSWAVFTRAPNTILALPLVLAWAWRWRQQRWWWVTVLAGLPALAVVMVINHRLFGSPWRTGYGDVGSLFSVEWLVPTLRNYAASLPREIPHLLLAGAALSVIGLAREPRRYGLLWVWALTYAGFYAFYRYTHEVWWYLRFVLPMFPAIVIAGGLVLQAAGQRLPRWGNALLVLVALGTGLGWNVRQNRELVFLYEPAQDAYVLIGQWVVTETDPSDVLVCAQASASLFHQTPNPIIRYEHLRPGEWDTLQQLTADQGTTLYAVLWEYELKERHVLETRIPGDWEFVRAFGTSEIYRLRR